MSSLLVTGGAGFMGSHVVDSLLTLDDFANARVVVLDDLSGGYLTNVPSDPRVKFMQGSVTDDDLIEQLFQQYRFDYVYHLAAYAAEGLSHFIRRFNYTNNLLGSVSLINASVRHRVRRLVYTSSIAVYGTGKLPLREADPPQPVDPYGIAKYAVELDLAAAHAMFGLDYTVFRPHNVYGERQNLFDKYRNVIAIFMSRLLEGQPMPVFGDGTQQRAFTYIGDVAPAIARSGLLPQAANQVFNLGSDLPTSVADLAVMVAHALGVPAAVQHLEPRHEVHIAYCDHAKLRAVFPALSNTPLEVGLQRMADWARRVPRQTPRVFEHLEIEQQLPESWRC